MLICPYDTCISNLDGGCIRTDIVLGVDEGDNLKCESYIRDSATKNKKGDGING